MSQTATPSTNEIKKLQVKETVLFAINNIPQVDRATLEKFLELVNATGTFGAISHEQLVTKMNLTMKYIPGACAYSLVVLADLLELQVPSLPPALTAPQPQLISSGTPPASVTSHPADVSVESLR